MIIKALIVGLCFFMAASYRKKDQIESVDSKNRMVYNTLNLTGKIFGLNII